MRNGAILLGTLLLLLSVAIYWLFYSNQSRPSTPFPLDLAELRRLAGPVQNGPSRIEIERLSHTMNPKIAIVAGTDWGNIDMVRASYQLVYPDRTILIDTANDANLARRFKAARYDAAGWQRLVAAMDVASAIVVTHEHGDHIGGLLAGPHPERAFAHAVLTREQLNHKEGSRPVNWPDVEKLGVRPLDYDRLHPLAPGVVLIKAAGHSPGSQMVYVRRADGHEFFFMGDTASMTDNVRLERLRSRYVTDWYHGGPGDDRDAVMAQTIALHDLQKANPRLTLVPGHDGAAMAALIKIGLFAEHFSQNLKKRGSPDEL